MDEITKINELEREVEQLKNELRDLRQMLQYQQNTEYKENKNANIS